MGLVESFASGISALAEPVINNIQDAVAENPTLTSVKESLPGLAESVASSISVLAEPIVTNIQGTVTNISPTFTSVEESLPGLVESFTSSISFLAEPIIPNIQDTVTNNSLMLTSVEESFSGLAFLIEWYRMAMQCLLRSDTWPLIVSWWGTFISAAMSVLGLGFGPVGIVKGSLAAAFQSYMYGGLTPAGSLFSILTSLAMRGSLTPLAVSTAAITAIGVVLIEGWWGLGSGTQNTTSTSGASNQESQNLDMIVRIAAPFLFCVL